jgi:hypothetical protein
MAEDKDLKKLTEKAKEASKAQEKAANAQQKAQQKIADTVKEIANASKGLLGIENDLFDASKKLSGQQLKRLELQREILKDQLSSLQTDKSQLVASSKHFKEIQKTAKKVKEIADIEAKALPHRKKLLAAQKELNKFQDKYKNSIDQSLGFIDKIDDKIKDIPIIGDFLSKSLGLDVLKEEIGSKIGGALTNTFKKSAVEQQNAAQTALKGYDDQIDRLNGVENAASSITDIVSDIGPSMASGTGEVAKGMASAETAAMGFGTTLTIATGGLLLLVGAVVLAFKAFYDTAMETDKHITDIAKNLNVSKNEAAEIEHSAAHQKVLFENIVEYSDLLSKNFGRFSHVLAKDVMPRMQSLQFNMQLSNEELGGAVSAATLLGSSFAGTADKASEFETTALNTTKEFYEQQGIQLTQGDLVAEFRQNMQDISVINKRNLALYGKSDKALVKQVQTIRRFGLEFDQVAKISESVLDIESSIENEMKANVLLGKHMNLNAVRQAALYGDQAKVAEEVNKVLSSQNINLDEFNKMMPIQKKALAESLGLGEDEIQNMLLRNKLGDEDLAEKIKTGKITTKQLVATGKLTEYEAQSLINAERKTTVQQDMAMIQDQLSQSIKANMPGIQSFIKVLADFGTRAQDVGLLRAMFGGGKTEAEQQADKAQKENGDISEELAKKATADADTGFGTYLWNAITTGSITDAVIHDLFLDKEYKATTNSNKPPAQDFVMRPGQAPLQFSKGDLVMGIDEGSLSKYSTTSTDTTDASSNTMSTNSMLKVLLEQNSLLKELIAKVDQPVRMNINGRVMDEIEKQTTLRKTYNTKVDSGYGTFG